MFELKVWRLPWAQRRCFLATRDIAPQGLAAETRRDLAHLAAGTCEVGDQTLLRGLFVSARGIIVQVVAYAVAGRLALLAAVLASSRIFEDFEGLQGALLISGGYLLFQLIGAFFTSRSDVARGHLAAQAELYLTTRINRKLLRLDPQSVGEFSMGNLKTLVSSDVRYFSEFVTSLAWNVTPALASVLILGPVVYMLAGIPGAIGVVLAFGNVPVALAFSQKMQKATSSQQVYLDRVATLVGEWLRNVRLSRYLGWQGAFERDIAGNVRSYVRAFAKRHLIACLTFGISFAWWMVPVIAMLLASKLLSYPLELLGFFASLWIIKDLSEYLQHLPHTVNLSASAAACLRRIERLEAAPELSRLFTRHATQLPSDGARVVGVALCGVSFSYNDAQLVLSGIDAVFDLTKRTALVGEVGAGKTTLLRILCGELAPKTGDVFVMFSDHTKAPLWDERIYRRYRSEIAYVPQEPFIANDTLAANIALEAGEVGAAHIEAAYLAELEADLTLLPKGYEELIGETGVTLSGGQRQRVNLARAFYACRRLLLLDDPLSAVDVRTESILMANMLRSSEGMILVSHRLGELNHCDRLVVMEGGRIIEDGNPKDLMAQSASRYSSLLRTNMHV